MNKLLIVTLLLGVTTACFGNNVAENQGPRHCCRHHCRHQCRHHGEHGYRQCHRCHRVNKDGVQHEHHHLGPHHMQHHHMQEAK